MPSTLTYPGVYIEEVPSGVRTITGVATSITAFIGRTPRGPLNEPTIVNNFGEFERMFGGLARHHTVGYAVQDFFANGGAQAILVRLYKPLFANDAARQLALTAATGQAQTAANAIKTAAASAAALGGATAGSVAAAAGAAVIAAGAPGLAAMLAAQDVAAAAETESKKPPYMTTSQRLKISGSPTGGTVKLKFNNAETPAVLLTALIGGTGEATLKGALEGLATIGAGNIGTVARSGGSPNFSFLITFGGALAGPQSLLELSNNSLSGGTNPMVTISLPLPDAASVEAAAANAISTAVSAAAGTVAPLSKARLAFGNGLTLEASTPGSWGNSLHIKVDQNTKPKDDGTADPTCTT